MAMVKTDPRRERRQAVRRVQPASRRDDDCVDFLQWALPQIGLQWSGFRRVRGQVCKRITRRRTALGLPDLPAFRDHLQAHPDEWAALRALCAVTISCFYRDRDVFESLAHTVMPTLVAKAALRPDHTLSCWSIGCASGEEPYTLSILWHLEFAPRYPQIGLLALATDVDPKVLARAAAARYTWPSVKDLPATWRSRAFDAHHGEYRLREAFRAPLRFEQQDIRQRLPAQSFDLILCRNVVLTYFAPAVQREVLAGILTRLRRGGALVVGLHESLPPDTPGLEPWPATKAIFRKTSDHLASG